VLDSIYIDAEVLAYHGSQFVTIGVALGITVGTDVSEGVVWLMHPEKIDTNMINVRTCL
jgi:hypothetical protein